MTCCSGILFHYLVWLLGFGLTVFRGSILFSCQENTFSCILKNKRLAAAFKILFHLTKDLVRIKQLSFMRTDDNAPRKLVLIRNLLSKQKMLYPLIKDSNSKINHRIWTQVTVLHQLAQFIKLSFKGRPS